jgi:hypothetical protein
MPALVYYHPSAKQFIVLQNKPNKPILYYLEHTHTCCSICELRHSLDPSQRKLRLGAKEARKTSQYDIKILAAHGCHTPSVCVYVAKRSKYTDFGTYEVRTRETQSYGGKT